MLKLIDAVQYWFAQLNTGDQNLVAVGFWLGCVAVVAMYFWTPRAR